jgi:MFS family permease
VTAPHTAAPNAPDGDRFAALKQSSNYRRYLYGQSVSLAGTWMQTVAQGWLVLQLTGSGTRVGLVTAAQYLPVLLLAPTGGLLADRIERRRILLATQLAFAVLAGVLGVLTVTHSVRMWMVYLVAVGFARPSSPSSSARSCSPTPSR